MKKLVRDLIPEVDAANGGTGRFCLVVDAAEYDERLGEKLGEEWGEVRDATTTADKLVELADMLEVIDAMAVRLGATFDDLCAIKLGKRAERGGFTRGVVWLGTSETAASPGVT